MAGNGGLQQKSLPGLICAPSIIVEQLPEPHYACVGHNDGRTLTISSLLSDF